MSAHNYLRKLLLAVTAVMLVASLLARASQAAPPAHPTRRAVADLQSRAAGSLYARYDPTYGNVSFFFGPMPFAPRAAARGNALATAIEFLVQNPDLYQMTDPLRELALIRTSSDELGQVHVRLGQQLNGVPVFARSLYVHLDARGQVLGTNGHFVPGLALSTVPAIDAATAEHVAQRAMGTPKAEIQAGTQLVIYPSSDGLAQLAWKVAIYDRSVLAREIYFVDASRSARVLHVTSGLMHDKDRIIYDAHNTEDLPGELAGREGEVPTDDGAASVYGFLGDMYDYYLETHNRDSFDDRGATMIATVHFAEDFNNSYWDGEQMVYGDGDGVVQRQSDAFVDDTTGHELTHAVVQYTADLVYEEQSGALNESYADVFAAMFDREDWTLFEDDDYGPPYPFPYSRDMQDPNMDGHYDPEDPLDSFGQPAHMGEYANLPNSRRGDWGGVHVNSGIPNHAAYLTAQNAGGDVDGRVVVEKIWYRALANYLTETSDFADFAEATLRSAAELYGEGSAEHTAAEEALTTVGILGGSSATPQPQASATPRKGTPAPQPTAVNQTGCSELIKDGGFERGPDDGIWYESTLPDVPIIAEESPHTGKMSAWLGGTDAEQFAFHYIFQDVKIPANAKSVTLGYWHYLVQVRDENTDGESVFQSVLANEDGDTLAVLEELSSGQGTGEWVQSLSDVKKQAGKTVRVAFSASMVEGDPSNWWVDDVSMLACTGAAPPPGPTPKPQGDGITVGGLILDYGTGEGIEGATVWFLNPGTTADDAAEDGNIEQDEVFTSGVSDRNGQFVLDDPLARDTVFSVIVIADGYFSLIANNAVDTGDWGDVDEFMDLYAEMEPAN